MCNRGPLTPSTQPFVLFLLYVILSGGGEHFCLKPRTRTFSSQRSAVVRCIQFGQKRRAGSSILELTKENKVLIGGVVYDASASVRRPQVSERGRTTRRTRILAHSHSFGQKSLDARWERTACGQTRDQVWMTQLAHMCLKNMTLVPRSLNFGKG